MCLSSRHLIVQAFKKFACFRIVKSCCASSSPLFPRLTIIDVLVVVGLRLAAGLPLVGCPVRPPPVANLKPRRLCPVRSLECQSAVGQDGEAVSSLRCYGAEYRFHRSAERERAMWRKMKLFSLTSDRTFAGHHEQSPPGI